MLVLTRKPGERVVIESSAGPLVVTVLDVKESGSAVRLGFDGQPSIGVWREEIYVERTLPLTNEPENA